VVWLALRQSLKRYRLSEKLVYNARMRRVVLASASASTGYIARPMDRSISLMPKDYSMGPFFATIDYGGHGTQDLRMWLSKWAEAPTTAMV